MKYILVLNAGSSSLKFKLFEKNNLLLKVSGICERIGLPGCFLVAGDKKWKLNKISSHNEALHAILQKINLKPTDIDLIGHRVVHGGEKFHDPVVVTKKVWRQISEFNDLAPLHNPVSLAVIKSCYAIFPRVKNLAVFDTAYYHDLRPEVYLYALPEIYYKKYHIRRYGFHGISHHYIAQVAAGQLGKPVNKINLISCHFGNGNSITAIKNGKPIDTTMGFTPLEGLTMGTRSGDIDPSIPIYLIEKLKMKPAEVSDLLNKKSGLLAISGFSADMREILSAAGKPVYDYRPSRSFTPRQRARARLALAMFIYDVRRYLSSYAGLLGKIDAIIFTGGIGERSKVIREMALEGITFSRRPKVLTIKSDEELAIARQIAGRRL